MTVSVGQVFEGRQLTVMLSFRRVQKTQEPVQQAQPVVKTVPDGSLNDLYALLADLRRDIGRVERKLNRHIAAGDGVSEEPVPAKRSLWDGM